MFFDVSKKNAADDRFPEVFELLRRKIFKEVVLGFSEEFKSRSCVEIL